jgi:Phosphotransferase enzyme family
MTLFAYSSTHHIEEVGPDLLCKDLSTRSLVTRESARPRLLDDPTREPAAYRDVLAPLGIGPRCLATGDDWVLLERVASPVLWQIGALTVWVEVASWVARLHRQLAAVDLAGVPLVTHDAALYRAWRERAERAGSPAIVLEAHERATEQLLALPCTVIHGDLYPSNLLVDPGPPLRVWPVDWELIGCGPAVLDVAALTSGAWTAEQRSAMVDAFTWSTGTGTTSQFAAALDAARLHLCIQWLGTPPDWTPPPDHAHDWLTEALELAVAL